MIDLSFVLPICFLPQAKKRLPVSGNFRFDSCLRRIRNTNNFDRFLKVFLHYNGTSHLRHIHLEDIKFGPGKCSHNLCIFYLYWGDPSIQGKRAIFLGPEHGHLIALKRWLTTKIVDNFKSLLDTMATAFKTRSVSLTSMYCTCGNSTHNIAGMS